MKMHVSFAAGMPRPQMDTGDFSPQFAPGADFWRIHLDTGEIRELTVFSTQQDPPQVTRLQGETAYTYPRLKAENGAVFDITYVLTIREENGGLTFL